MGLNSFDVYLEFDRDISSGREFDVLESVLRRHAPKWSARMRVENPPGRVVEPGVGDLKAAILDISLERSPELLRMLEASGTAGIRSGFCEIDGATGALCVVPDFHERIMQGRHDGGLAFNNNIAIQVRAVKVDGVRAAAWIPPVFEELCAALGPVWAHAESTAEFFAKLMDNEGGGLQRIGLDYSRYLPALFPLNFFGPAYVNLIGRDRLASIPCGRFVEYPHGVLIEAGPLDAVSATAEPVLCQEAILDHLGRQYFFSREDPDRRTIAPDWSALE